MADLQKNVGALFAGAGQKAHSLVAGAASDNSEKEGAVINRLAHGNAQSAKVQVAWETTCTDAKKLTLTVKRYQSADGSNWDAAETRKAATDVFVAANPVLSGSGILELNEDISDCKQYVKYSVIADLDAANTDVASYGLIVNLGGQEALPAV